MARTLTIGIPIYPGVDLLDIAGPHEVLTWMNTTWPGSTVTALLVAEKDAPVATSHGIRLLPDTTFARCPKLDVLFVPGGPSGPIDDAVKSKPLLRFLHRHGDAEWVCSVCTGALLLSAAGLLDGYQATTHWASQDDLRANPKVRVVDGYPRYVVDGNRVTGGGLSSGLDEGLALCRILSGDPNVERRTQLLLQYHPQPDYDCGDPNAADSFVLYSLQQAMAQASSQPKPNVAVWKVVGGAEAGAAVPNT